MERDKGTLHQILEGMRAGDLGNLVLPLLSIDEYESKIDDDAIVVGFYVGDQDAARDLNRFIQRSPVMLLDSEVSPAPDQNSNYLVFVELMNNQTTVKAILDIVEEVSSLCGIDDWKAQVRGNDDLIDVTGSSLAPALARNRAYDRQGSKNIGENSLKEVTLDLLGESRLDHAYVISKGETSRVVIQCGCSTLAYALLGAGPHRQTLIKSNLSESGENLSVSARRENLEVARLLGVNWNVSTVVGGSEMIWHHIPSDSCIIVK